jgi:hypothetical protein
MTASIARKTSGVTGQPGTAAAGAGGRRYRPATVRARNATVTNTKYATIVSNVPSVARVAASTACTAMAATGVPVRGSIRPAKAGAAPSRAIA